MTDGEAQDFVAEFVAARAAGNPSAWRGAGRAIDGKITQRTMFSGTAPLRAGRPRDAMKRLRVAAGMPN